MSFSSLPLLPPPPPPPLLLPSLKVVNPTGQHSVREGGRGFGGARGLQTCPKANRMYSALFLIEPNCHHEYPLSHSHRIHIRTQSSFASTVASHLPHHISSLRLAQHCQVQPPSRVPEPKGEPPSSLPSPRKNLLPASPVPSTTHVSLA